MQVVSTVQLITQLVYMLVWSITLCKLFKDFKGSESMLPRKQSFIMHAALLIVYFLIVAGGQISFYYTVFA